MTDKQFDSLISTIEEIPEINFYGKVTKVQGLLVECTGIHELVSVGSRCKIITRDGEAVLAEVIGFDGKEVMLMPFTEIDGIGGGCRVIVEKSESVVRPDISWMGRVINALGEPVDDGPPLIQGSVPYLLKNKPPPAHRRSQVKGKIDLGVRSINTFATCCKGQRIGIFAGSGVGKSMLVAMLTKYSEAEIKVIGLIGERGREVQEFIQEYLGKEGLKKAIIIVATSNESALMRKQAAFLTLSVAEYFRDEGKDVLCLMDSVTRFAMAQREIGLSAGEPPTTRGYTPTVFAELPKLLERAGPGEGKGSITGLFSVLVEGDDHNEPISDAVRAILDGHIVLDRAIAERGRFPAVNVLKSVSRTMPACNNDAENKIVAKARSIMTVHNDMAEMIRLGAYRKGSDQKVDEAIMYIDDIEEFLQQDPTESSSLEDGYQMLENILNKKQQKEEPQEVAKND
jgi:flagellum-specific ATP synthase